MHNRRRQPQPESSPEKQVYGIRLISSGPSAGFHFNLPEGQDSEPKGKRRTLADTIRRTAERTGKTEEDVWEMFRGLAKVYDEDNVGLGRPLSVEEAMCLLLLTELRSGTDGGRDAGPHPTNPHRTGRSVFPVGRGLRALMSGRTIAATDR